MRASLSFGRSALLATTAIAAAWISGACHGPPAATEMAQAPLNRASQPLLDYLFNPLSQPTLSAVKQYLDDGAELEAKDAAGATAFSIVCENISQNIYIFREGDAQQPARVRALVEVAIFLIDRGADVTAADGRGITPMSYLTQFVPPEVSGPVIQKMLARRPNLDVGDHRTGPVHMIGKGVGHPVFDAILADAATYHLDLRRKTEFGQTVLHINARRKPLPDGTLPIRKLLEMLPEGERPRLADAPDDSGASPLFWASMFGNLAAVDYLLTSYRIDVQRRMADGSNAADLAKRFQRADVVARLAQAGLSPSAPPDEETVVCNGPNPGKLSYPRLEKIIRTCTPNLRSLDALLPLLPASIRSSHIEFYAGRGLQGASFENPRVVMFERDGGIVLAFNGAPNQALHEQLEVHSFDQSTRTFSLREIDFARAPHGQIAISEPNPAKCTGCHGRSARPLWDAWKTWAGMYGGDDMVGKGKVEQAGWETFLAIKDRHPRYRTLLPQHHQGIDVPTGPYLLGLHWVVSETINQSEAVFTANLSQSISRQLAEATALQPYRFAVLASLSCNQPIEDFLPAGHQFPKENRTYAAVEQNTVDRALTQMREHYKFTDRTLPGGQVSHEVVFHRKVERPYPDFAGFSHDIPQTSKLRFVVEGVLGDGAMSEWSTFFAPGAAPNTASASYVLSVGWLESMAWKDLLSPTADADVYNVFETEAARIRPQGAGYVASWIGQGSLLQRPEGLAAQARLCPLLKTKSIAALTSR